MSVYPYLCIRLLLATLYQLSLLASTVSDIIMKVITTITTTLIVHKAFEKKKILSHALQVENGAILKNHLI